MKKIAAFALVMNLFSAEIVTDPVSYTYFVEQINQVTLLINNATEQVRTLGGIKTLTDDIKKSVYKMQDSITGAMQGFADAGQGLFDEINNMDDTAKDIFSMDRDSLSTDSTQQGILYRSTSELIDEVFTETGMMPVAEFLEIRDSKLRQTIKKDVAQYAFRKLIYDQDAFADRRKQQQERTVKIYEEITKAEDMVNMQKSTAALLQELIMVQTEMLQLQKNAIVAYAYAQYKGVDLNKIKSNLKTLKDQDSERRAATYESKKPENLFPTLHNRQKASMEAFDQYMGR
jgi:hypothetical protein